MLIEPDEQEFASTLEVLDSRAASVGDKPCEDSGTCHFMKMCRCRCPVIWRMPEHLFQIKRISCNNLQKEA